MENMQSNHADVFLSYSHDDRVVVEKIAALISDAGFSCWIDKERLRAQEPYNPAIDIAIDQATVFVAFLSKTYVNKAYCIREFNMAIEKQKSMLAVCIDDVNNSTNKQSAYMLSASVGYNILGLNTGVEDSDSGIRQFAEKIVNSVPMELLKRYLISSDEKDYPPITASDYFIAQLRLYHEHQYVQSENYALNEIRGELFPAIKNPEINILYKDDQRKNVSLVQFLTEKDGQENQRRHTFITGEGGMGKTVSLLKTCEYLLDKKVNAIYIPLSKINENLTLDQYLERVVCGGNQCMWQELKGLMSVPYASIPNVVLLLDGINEVSLKYVNTFVEAVKNTYIDSYRGIKLVMTSRWFDNALMHKLRDNVTLLEMQALDKESIDQYLQSVGLPSVTDEKVLSVIRTPLMLTLFADVERHKDKYQNIEGIVLEENPNTAGKILSNFFQTQLYRAAEEENFDRAAHLVLLEYLLPSIAYKMLEKNSMYLSDDEVWDDAVEEIRQEDERYTWYKSDKLRRLIRGRNRIDADALIDLADSALHFLHKTDAGYEFLHQSFRDYFAAFHIANEMKAFAKNPNRREDVDPVLQQSTYPDDILSFVSDILHEENARPVLTEDGWTFPGKEDTVASKESVAEQLLPMWRDEAGEPAQNAVANLVNVMRIGRRQMLAWCDFSHLDLRKCWLNKCRFTVWYRDHYYPSTFDGAWLDRANFLTDGHEAQISALAFDGRSRVFSGDKAGTVKIYSMEEHAWVDTIRLQSGAVIDLAWNDAEQLLAIMYENIVFCYSMQEKCVVSSYGNSSKSKTFRYVQFSQENEINVAFDLEPLVWCDVHGQKLPTGLAYDVPARCARWNPRRKEFIRSNLLQLLSVRRYDDSTLSWELPPALKKRLEDDNKRREETQKNPRETFYLSLRDAGAEGTGSISCIQYNGDGTRVLVAIQTLLVEYDAETFDILNRKTFSEKVLSECYINKGVGAGINLFLLDTDFSEEAVLRGSQIRSINVVAEEYAGDGYYVFSSNGEIKKLNHELIVQSMRAISGKGSFVWVRDRLTNEIQMAFQPAKYFPFGSRYSYEAARLEPLGWRYEFVDLPANNDDEQEFYKMYSSLLVIEKVPPYRKMQYTNYTGIWIFGCSFGGIQGDMATRRNSSFLVQNGGIVHDTNG